MKAAIAALPLFALTAACATYSEPPATTAVVADSATETERLNEWFEQKFIEELAFRPQTQTELGIKTDYDKLNDFSIEGMRAHAKWWQDMVAEMEATFDYDALTDEAQISWDVVKYRAREAQLEYKFADRTYVLHQMHGEHAALPSFLLSQHTVDSDSDMVAFIARLRALGPAIDQLLTRAQANAEGGVRPPRFAYDAVIRESQALITGAPFDDGEPSALWAGTEGHLAKLVADGIISKARAGTLREQARAALLESMAPSYQRLIDWFTADRPNADEQPRGVAALPDGDAYYAYRLAASTTTEMTPDQVHRLGLSEVARIRGEMEAIREKVGFEGTLQEFFEFVRTDDQFFFPNTDAGADMFLAKAKGYIDAITPKLPQYFGRLPKAPLEVRRVEPFREQPGAAQHYRPGTPDGSRPGIYYAHLSDMRAMPIPNIETTAYHEGNPGHHMQVSIAQETQGLPRFRTQGWWVSAFGEGWALYSEALAKEMGGFTDPYQDFGRLQAEMWRAIRLVVDTGIHSKGWTNEQAVAFALENSSRPETAVRSEMRRYTVWPGQATSYKIGMIRIQQLRARAERELGEDFDIRGFHDTVLGGGDIPLGILERRVDNWIAKKKAE